MRVRLLSSSLSIALVHVCAVGFVSGADPSDAVVEQMRDAFPPVTESVQSVDTQVSPICADPNEIFGDPTQGWNILSDAYTQPNLLDGISIEWEYFMVHAEPVFTGIVAVILADPRSGLVGLMPSGGNIAIAGKFGNGKCGEEGTYCVTNFVNTGLDFNATKLPDKLSFQGQREASLASIKVTEQDDGSPAIHFQGSSPSVDWDLTIWEDWSERQPFPVRTGCDLSLIPGEHWTVNMLWPRTRIQGTMRNKESGSASDLTISDAHGYRENSFGRWLFVLGGWDFATFSSEESGVMWAWQSYHKGKQLDSLDVSFQDGTTTQSLSFEASHGELGWYHDDWTFYDEARQCIPTDATVEAANEEYYIHAKLTFENSQVPLLSATTPVTDLYVIMEWMPTMEGEIYRQSNGEMVTEFSGIAGGEISFLRDNQSERTDEYCKWWGKPTFMEPLKQDVRVSGITRHACAQLNTGRPFANFWACFFSLWKGCLWAPLRQRCY